METSFSKLLKTLIDARFPSNRAFARAVSKVGENVGQAYLAKILTGLHPPIIERAEAWADVLELKGDERQRFMDLAAIAHLPVEVRPHFVTLLVQLKSQQATIDLLKVRLHALESKPDGISKQ